ncbi:MAG: nucleotidyltransferase domain-containing protein [Candidatus Omnitrophota bacterium]
MMDITPYKEQIRQICEELHLKKLDIFGSARTDQFGPKSDVDVIVEFTHSDDVNSFDVYFELKSRLKELFNRPVDIITEKSLKNPYLIKKVSETREKIYAS